MSRPGVWHYPRRHSVLQKVRTSEALRERSGRLSPLQLLNMQPIPGVRHRTCQWIVQDGRPPLFCAGPAEPGKSWCAHHLARVFASDSPEETRMADQRLVSIVERILRLEEEKKGLAADIKDVMAEAKSAGYDLPGLRLAIREQRETAVQRRKREAAEQTRDLILAALGEFATTPLGQAAAG